MFFIIIFFPRFEVKPSRQAEGAASLQAQWGFEELGSQDEQLVGDECESHLEIAVFLMSLPFDTIEKSETKTLLTVLGLPNYKSAWYLRHC